MSKNLLYIKTFFSTLSHIFLFLFLFVELFILHAGFIYNVLYRQFIVIQGELAQGRIYASKKQKKFRTNDFFLFLTTILTTEKGEYFGFFVICFVNLITVVYIHICLFFLFGVLFIISRPC